MSGEEEDEEEEDDDDDEKNRKIALYSRNVWNAKIPISLKGIA